MLSSPSRPGLSQFDIPYIPWASRGRDVAQAGFGLERAGVGVVPEAAREAPGSQVGQLGVLTRSYWLFQEGLRWPSEGAKINDLRN